MYPQYKDISMQHVYDLPFYRFLYVRLHVDIHTSPRGVGGWALTKKG